MNITIYTKTGCPWGKQALDFLNQHGLAYQEKNMTENPEFMKECEEKTGQSKCPTLDIDGKILADSDAKQIEEYLKEIGVLK